MPGKRMDSRRLQPSRGAVNYPLSIITMADLPAVLVPRHVAEKIAAQYLYQSSAANPLVPLSPGEEKDFIQYGYRSRLPVFLSGDTVNRAGNIVQVDGSTLHLGDVPFALFMRLVAELFKNKSGMIPKSRLINAGYIKADGEFQSISRLRQAFRTALGGLDPQDFIEGCRPGYLRLSTHPALVTYDKPKLLSHRNIKVRRLARQLP